MRELGLKPMGTGPYKLKQWAKEDRLTLEAFPDYYGGKAKIDTVVFRPITNPATRTAALLTGELDVVQDLAVRDIERVKAEAGVTVLTRPSLLNILLAMDVRETSPTIALDKNPMTDRRVREAIARAIDVATIDRVIMNGLATPSRAIRAGVASRLRRGRRFPRDVPVRPRPRQGTDDGSGLCRRLHDDAGRHQQPLRQRRAGRAGPGLDAGEDRRSS